MLAGISISHGHNSAVKQTTPISLNLEQLSMIKLHFPVNLQEIQRDIVELHHHYAIHKFQTVQNSAGQMA